jgi:mono/diheme cytochrome c family protein
LVKKIAVVCLFLVPAIFLTACIEMGGELTPDMINSPPPDEDGGTPTASAGEVVYDQRCAGCHSLGGYDTSGSPNLSGNAAGVDAEYPNPGAAGHKGVTLSATQITDLKTFIASI